MQATCNRSLINYTIVGAVMLFTLLYPTFIRSGGMSVLALSDLSLPGVSGEQLAEVSKTSGVSGTLWTATKIRNWTGPLYFRNQVDDGKLPEASPEALDAWFAGSSTSDAETRMRRTEFGDSKPKSSSDSGGGGGAAAAKPSAPECKSNKWVVITSIFAPSELMYQLERLDGWCTVVVADKKTPPEAWAEVTASGRVKLLTVGEQKALGFKSASFLPWNHFGRKNLGYLYAIAAGAQWVYDTDDDNILKEGPNGEVHIPVLRETDPRHGVGQAWHCAHDNGHENNGGGKATRSWNPYEPFGAKSSWPRGYPLDDVAWSITPCNPGTANRSYHVLGHHLPGISFGVQQSLADGHPDIDGIHRLVKIPLIFGFDAHTPWSALYGPDDVYSPYNAQATLHKREALWGMLLPVTVHGRVSDIWRSYFTQRLMWQYGMRVVFTRAFVNQDRTPHNYLKDFQSELPLYLRAGGLVDFLRRWRPSRDDLTLPAQYEELLVALWEHDVIEAGDVRLAQAWLRDLSEMGYAFPSRASHGLYSAWTSSTNARGSAGTIALIADSAASGSPDYLRSVLPPLKGQTYPIAVFYDSGAAAGDNGWASDASALQQLRSLVGHKARVDFFPVQSYASGDDDVSGDYERSDLRSYGGNGVARHPAVSGGQYVALLHDASSAGTAALTAAGKDASHPIALTSSGQLQAVTVGAATVASDSSSSNSNGNLDAVCAAAVALASEEYDGAAKDLRTSCPDDVSIGGRGAYPAAGMYSVSALTSQPYQVFLEAVDPGALQSGGLAPLLWAQATLEEGTSRRHVGKAPARIAPSPSSSGSKSPPPSHSAAATPSSTPISASASVAPSSPAPAASPSPPPPSSAAAPADPTAPAQLQEPAVAAAGKQEEGGEAVPPAQRRSLRIRTLAAA